MLSSEIQLLETVGGSWTLKNDNSLASHSNNISKRIETVIYQAAYQKIGIGRQFGVLYMQTLPDGKDMQFPEYS